MWELRTGGPVEKNTVAEPRLGSHYFVRWSFIGNFFFPQNVKTVNNITVDGTVDADFRVRSGNVLLIPILYVYLNFKILKLFLQMDLAGNPFNL